MVTLLSVSNVKIFRINAMFFHLKVWNVIAREGIRCYCLWMHQMLSRFEYLQCYSMCSPYVSICFYLICIVYPNLFKHTYVCIVYCQTDRCVDKWQEKECVRIDLTDSSISSRTDVTLTEERDKSEVGKVFWEWVVCLKYKNLFFVCMSKAVV